MAPTRVCLFALVGAVAFLFFLDGAAEARTVGTSSAQRRRQVRSLLRRLNKPPLATIESPDGDIIDCVHISKQPAFDHPLLENHTIQMMPPCHPEGPSNKSNIAPNPFIQTWHQNGKCPENTIPIRRTKEEDVLRVSSIERYGKKWPWSIPNRFSLVDPDTVNVLRGHQHAIASAPEDDNYYGTQATFNLWEPIVERDEGFSLAQFWISSGSYPNNDLNTIEAGWQVYPGLYKDSHTRLFIYWTRDAYNKTGCYNLLCSGFIQTSNQIAIGATNSYLSPVSIYGGSQYDITILVWKDPKEGNWWLQVGGHDLGYWPTSIFSKLAGSAASVEWGGEVASSPDAGQTSTQMGSGHFPEEGFSKTSYVKNIQLVDSTNNLKSPSGVNLLAKWPNCYNVQNGTSADWGTYIFYGGPGKNPNCQ
ncbi:protein neprosin-like [Miscanthus floridulus]|uniref:protein neprosin-like n=1 Tax=Miscanthus floridulus TaxID=154761 RepID=UPI00345A61A8